MGDNDENPFINRNPWVLPEQELKVRSCPACKSIHYSGRNVQGAIMYTCSNQSCKNQWQGGSYQAPEDPKVPKMPINPKDKARVTFALDPKTKDIVEIDYPVDLTQDFRKGALISDEDDYE